MDDDAREEYEGKAVALNTTGGVYKREELLLDLNQMIAACKTAEERAMVTEDRDTGGGSASMKRKRKREHREKKKFYNIYREIE